MRIVLVYNPKSGSVRQIDEMLAVFDEAGFDVVATIQIDRRLRSKLSAHIKSAATIAAIGGDGTISTVAGMVAGTRATLLPLPGGTFNHFTKDLDVSQDLEVAINDARNGKAYLVDIGLVNDVAFINNSSIGLYPTSLRERDRFEKWLGKWLAAVVAAVRTLFHFRLFDVTIDGKDFKTPFIFIGNNKYKVRNGIPLRSRLNEGVLSVFAVSASSRFELLKMVGYVVVGGLRRHEKIDSFMTKELVIHAKQRRVAIAHDGEFTYMTSPFTYRVRSKQLRVLLKQ